MLPGDFNYDGTVDAADYVMWRKTDGSQAGYNSWREHFGQSAGSGSFSDGTVPEPSSAWLFVPIAFAAIRSWRRWRRECHQLVTA